MFEKLKDFIYRHKEAKRFLKENLAMSVKIKQLEQKQADPILIVQKLFNQGIEYYDFEDLPEQERKNYYEDIKNGILENEAVQNVKNMMVAKLTQKVVTTPQIDEEENNKRLEKVQWMVEGVEYLFSLCSQVTGESYEKKKTIYNTNNARS